MAAAIRSGLLDQLEVPMRPIIFVICLGAAACGGQSQEFPTIPTSPTLAIALERGSELHFSGTYTVTGSSTFTPPTTLVITNQVTGTAAHVGRFTAVSVDNVDVTNDTSTGTINLTSANGDQLFATTAGQEDEFVPPNISRTTVVATVVGGTGRFASATGTFTMRTTTVIDFGTATSTGSGSFEGLISLNR
jgi:hypothetical protein